jgi:nucleotide-binding universal stress UspA family protein
MVVPQHPSIGAPLLIPFDGSANAEVVLPHVPCLVGADRKIVLMQVVPTAQAITNPIGKEMLSPGEVQRLSHAAAQADLERAAAAIREQVPDADIETIVEIGEPAAKIAQVASERQIQTIVMASQGVSGTGPGGFGSIISRVIRTSPVPVAVIRAGVQGPAPPVINRFVIAHDGSAHADRALAVVEAPARRLSANLHVVTVVEDEESPIPAGVAATLDPTLRDEARADALNRARQSVEEVGARLLRRGLPASWRVLAGPAAPAILSECAAGDVLVIASHGRSESLWTLGGVAEKLVREATVPVVLLRTLDRTPGTETA